MKSKLIRYLLIIGIPLLVLFGIYVLFNSNRVNGDLFAVMSISFLFLVPFGVGALTIYVSPVDKVKHLAYRVTTPWVPLFAFLIITLLFSWEGAACWLMALPLFMIASTAGGLVAGYLKLKRHKNERTYVSFLLFLPLLVAPVEQYIGSHPDVYEAYTYIDLHAGKADIWNHVTRVSAIRREQDKGWLTRTLGFPRPVRAELNYNGIGAYRKAIFEKGLIFHETVLEYEDQRRMRFSIKAHPYEIPSTTMDEHVVIGGDYFDVIDGTYALQKLNANTYRLHLYSHYKLTTTFNFYASWWAGWIMKDIQNNILQVIKERVE